MRAIRAIRKAKNTYRQNICLNDRFLILGVNPHPCISMLPRAFPLICVLSMILQYRISVHIYYMLKFLRECRGNHVGLQPFDIITGIKELKRYRLRFEYRFYYTILPEVSVLLKVMEYGTKILPQFLRKGTPEANELVQPVVCYYTHFRSAI